jgi:LysM repeat protein/ABC-type branched-subunit amino acid transport system substrate-binding protein
MKRIVITLMAACLLLGAGLPARAQDTGYKATPVTISRDRVRKDGKLFYSHVVLERQTLFSISKAYGVTIEDIYEANPTLNLEKEGLKTYQILMIPVSDNLPAAQEEAAEPAPQDEKPAAADKPSVTSAPQSEDYIVHTVKWFEDLNSIAKKYGVSKEAIMRANGMTSPTVSRKQKLLIPTGAAAEEPVVEVLPPVTDEEEEEEERPKSIFETIGEAISEKADEWLYAGKKDITAALIMPFNAQKSPSENNLEFYSGVLLAAYDLKSEGINVDLSVYDAVGGNIPVSADKLSSCDVVIGPVSTADLTSTLRIAPSGTTIVSPLEPKAVELARMYDNLVQAPSSAENQSEDLIDWLAEDFRTGDKIILLTEKNVTLTSAAAVMVSKLQESGLPYSTISYGVPEGRNIVSAIEGSASQGGATLLVVASESEAFVSDVVRNANLLALRNNRKSEIVLYGLSKIRSFDTIEIESLHNTNLHVAISYFVDYDSPAVQKFLMSYRALFNAEPGPFAFQGYDTAYNFMKMSSRYGRRWADKLDDEDLMRGLQSNFRFDHRDAHVNKAVRRVVYGPDFSIRLVN